MPRNQDLLKDRNTVLYKRYKELYDVKRKRYDDVLQQLAGEFFIAPATVHRIILKISAQKAQKVPK